MPGSAEMWAVAGSVIVAVIGLIGNIIISKANFNKAVMEMKAEFDKHNAIQDTKMDELTREVREHNNFARRMPVVEDQIKRLQDDVKELKK